MLDISGGWLICFSAVLFFGGGTLLWTSLFPSQIIAQETYENTPTPLPLWRWLGDGVLIFLTIILIKIFPELTSPRHPKEDPSMARTPTPPQPSPTVHQQSTHYLRPRLHRPRLFPLILPLLCYTALLPYWRHNKRQRLLPILPRHPL